MEPRPLSGDEERVLRLLLANELEAETFLDQLPLARVTRHWIEGLPSVDIEVEPGAPHARISGQTLPTEGDVTDEAGNPTGLIVVWVENGALAGLEYAWYTDEPPFEWPSSDRITAQLATYDP